jgi:nucleotide-binding universal stress UspA family protein
MAIRTILTYLPLEGSAAATMAAALKIAEPRKAHIIGLHLEPQFPVYSEYSAELPQDMLEQIRKAGTRTTDAIKRIFDDSIKSSAVTGEWRSLASAYALGEELLAAQTHYADLIVCAKPSEEMPDPWGDFSEVAILMSGRPVLLVPGNISDASMGDRVIIAWNNTRESARAVFDALDLMQGASKVKAITLIDDERERGSAEASGQSLVASLARHGITATAHVSHTGGETPGEALLSQLTDEGCDLLVMGGYSRSRLRETIFGGASRDILRDTWVPTLVSH